MTTQEYTALANALRERANRYERSIDTRIRKLAKLAHIDSGDCCYIHLHNCQVGGRDHHWPGVDYAIIHQMQALHDKRWDASKIVDRYLERVYFTRVLPVLCPDHSALKNWQPKKR